MSPATNRTALGGLAAVLALTLCACGPDGPVSTTQQSTAPRPRYPEWSEPMIGKPMSQIVHGRGDCKGVWDIVAMQYNGKPSGDTAAGWAWDIAAKQAVQHILFVDANDRVVGAATSGVSRPDVPAALPEITSKTTGWSGVMGITSGKVLAVGVTSRNAGCDLGSRDLNPNPV